MQLLRHKYCYSSVLLGALSRALDILVCILSPESNDVRIFSQASLSFLDPFRSSTSMYSRNVIKVEQTHVTCCNFLLCAFLTNKKRHHISRLSWWLLLLLLPLIWACLQTTLRKWESLVHATGVSHIREIANIAEKGNQLIMSRSSTTWHFGSVNN